MPDYDVIVIGGGINGLTCAAYLGKAGLKTALIEARGECGAHCDTVEAGIPGYLFNLHAVWMITPICPVKTIITEKGRAGGVILSDRAIYPAETITAKKVVSNVTAIPTFLEMVGEDKLGADMAGRLKKFCYEEQNIFTVHFALSGLPRFKSADYDEGIQRAYMGYMGGDTSDEMIRFGKNIAPDKRRIHDDIFCNYFITTLADPLQAPAGCHTSHMWLDVPPDPAEWKHGRLKGFSDWDSIKQALADQMMDTYEQYAPGFKSLVRDRLIYSPLDQYRNNPSAVKGNWAGGSIIPEQFYEKRPGAGEKRRRAGRDDRGRDGNQRQGGHLHL
jgi:beta-carotene ketolase (CrtO type)